MLNFQTVENPIGSRKLPTSVPVVHFTFSVSPAGVTILQQSSPAPALQKQSLKIKSLEQTKDSIEQAFVAQHIIDKSILKTIFDEVGPVVKPPPASVQSKEL